MRIRLHGLLGYRGGAARIAGTLEEGLCGAGAEVVRSCEIEDGVCGTIRASPGEVGPGEPDGALIHLHGSADYAACLQGLAGHRGRVLITLHDCRLFTAGCPFPLDCEGWLEACRNCPRGYGDVRVDKVLEALDAVDPLLLAPSRWMARLAARALPERRIRVVPNGVAWPGTPGDKRTARRRIGLRPEVRCVLFAAHGGRAAQYKAGDKWLEIWRRVESKAPGTVGLVAGGDETGRQGDLIFRPYLDEAGLRELMRAADVLAYPTRADNHPLLVLEAMSEGTACLAFATGGVVEQIIDEKTGYLVPPGRWDVFADRLAGLMQRPHAARRAGRNAFEAGRKRFGVERMLAGHLDIYRRVIQEAFPAASRMKDAASSAVLFE